MAPVADQVASLLLQREPTVEKLPTPLTESNRRADRARRHGHTATREALPAKLPRPERRCARCGGELPRVGRGRRAYCDGCLPYYQCDRYDAFIAAGRSTHGRQREKGIDPSHGGEAGKRRRASVARRKLEVREWNAAHPETMADATVFERKILPAIRNVSLSDLVRATGLTHGYLSQVRRGGKTPHLRHWPALRIGLPAYFIHVRRRRRRL
jgi:hypothetical protein